MEAELQEIMDKHRSLRKQDYEKYESEQTAHLNSKSEMRKLQDNLSEVKAKNEDLKRKFGRESNDIKVELEFTKENLTKTDQRYKDAQYKLENFERKVAESERECKRLKSQLHEQKQTLSKKKIQELKYNLKIKLSNQIAQMKEEMNQFKLDTLQKVMDAKKDNFSSLSSIIDRIQNAKSDIQQKEARYHDKNTRTLQKLEKELEIKTAAIQTLEEEKAKIGQELSEVIDKLAQAEYKISEFQTENNSLETEYKQCLQSIDDKNREIQKLKFSDSKNDKEEDAYKLTQIITSEIEKKYKEKLKLIIQVMDSCGQKYKAKIGALKDQVKTMARSYQHELELVEKENNGLISRSYHTHQNQKDSKVIITQLRDKEIEIVKLKSEKKLILDSSIRLKKDVQKYKNTVSQQHLSQ